MKTYIIKSDKDLLKFEDDYGYEIDGNAEFEYSTEFTGRLLVKGYLSIKAGGSIEAGEYSGIIAGLSITCKTTLTLGLKAFAGICNWRNISDEEKTITCGKMVGGVVEYGILRELGLPKEEFEETVEVAGKKFVKKDFEEAIRGLKEVK